MTPADAARVLAIAAALDPRMRAPGPEEAAARAVTWAEALDTDMPGAFAGRAVTAHYAEDSRTIMPADLNRGWRAHRKREAETARTQALLEEQRQHRISSVPMPPALRQQIRAAIGGGVTPDAE